MEVFRTDQSLQLHVSWLDEGAPPDPSEGADTPPIHHPDFAEWHLVARGPRLAPTEYDHALDAWIWRRTNDPGVLWLGLGATSPPDLFFRAANPTQLSGLLQRFFLHPPEPDEADHVFEVFLGLTPSMLQIETRLALDLFTHTIPLSMATAGTEEQPTPEGLESELVLQAEFETRHSQASIGLYGWHRSVGGFPWDGRVVTARLQYAPSPDAEIVRHYNLRHGKAFPEDIPVDVIGALYDMPNLSPSLLEREIRTGSEPQFHLAALALTLAHDPSRAQAAMRSWSLDMREDLSRLAQDLQRWLSQMEVSSES